MRNKSFEPHPDQTVIAQGIKIKGTLEAESDVWFDGLVEGDINSSGNITIANNAVVMGNLKGLNIMISGKVKGNINGGNKVLLQSGCQIEGNIKSSSLGVAEGAELNGMVNTDTGVPAKASGQ